MSSAPNKQLDVKVEYNDQLGKWQVYKKGIVIFTGCIEDAVVIRNKHTLTETSSISSSTYRWMATR
jgi:hypothetical protein